MASPSYNHQHAVNELHGTFYNWFKGKPCTPLTSPLDITLKKEEANICVVQPDLVVICDKDQINEKGKYMGTPDLVVEVLSPPTRSKDMIPKLDLYRQCGVKEYWIIDPMKAQVILFSLSDGEIADVNYFSQAHDSLRNPNFIQGYRFQCKICLRDYYTLGNNLLLATCFATSISIFQRIIVFLRPFMKPILFCRRTKRKHPRW